MLLAAAWLARAHVGGVAEECQGGLGACRIGRVEQEHVLIQVRGHNTLVPTVDASCGPGGMCPVGAPVHSGDSLFLGSHTGMRLAVDGPKVDATGLHRERWEIFTIVKASGGVDIFSGDDILLKAHTGKYLSVEGSEVNAKYEEGLMWQTFRLARRVGPGLLQSGDKISLIAHTQKRISVKGNAIVAKWEHDGVWEALSVQKVIPPWKLPITGGPAWVVPGDASTTTTTPFPLPFSALETMVVQSNKSVHWFTNPTGDCTVSSGCQRPVRASCKDGKGRIVNESRCLRVIGKPPGLEKCLILGRGSCTNVAVSDCKDVPGLWWNRWHKTCEELSLAGGCSGGHRAEVDLEGWRPGDRGYVRRACQASCRLCGALPRPPPQEMCACCDDPLYRAPNNWKCSGFAGLASSCEAYEFADDLLAACPRACGACMTMSQEV